MQLNRIINLCLCSTLICILNSCISSKLTKEFNAKKPSFKLIYSPVSKVEKKKSFGLIFTKYIDNAPNDSILLYYTNQFTLQNLHELGYSNIIIEDNQMRNNFWSATDTFCYKIKLDYLTFKESKYHESVIDSSSKTNASVKLREVQSKLSGSIFPVQNSGNVDFTQKIFGEASQSESQEGKFENKMTIQDIINNNKNGSIKYDYNVNRLGDEIFVLLCWQTASAMANDIDIKLKQIFRNTKSKLK